MTIHRAKPSKNTREVHQKLLSASSAKRLVRKVNLCSTCLKRQGAGVITSSLKGKTRAEDCKICNGLIRNIPKVAGEVKKKLKDYEFDSFLVGTVVPQKVLDQEDEIRSRFKIHGVEGIKTQTSRTIAAEISKLTSKKVDRNRPDLTLLVSLEDGNVLISPRAIWLSARYLKHIRGLPQRSSICRICNGLGCAQCNYRGSTQTSVQSLIEQFFSKELESEGCSFIWVGSEDEKSLVEGNGRPLYIEIQKPRKRHIGKIIPRGELDLAGVSLAKVEVLKSKPTAVPQFKVKCVAYLTRAAESPEVSGPEPGLMAEEIKSMFSHATVQVRLSRKDRVISKRIDSITVGQDPAMHNQRYLLEIECDGGIPIRKLILGGDDSVVPNLSPYISGLVLDPEMPFDIKDVMVTEARPRRPANRRKVRHVHRRFSGKDSGFSKKEVEESELI